MPKGSVAIYPCDVTVAGALAGAQLHQCGSGLLLPDAHGSTRHTQSLSNQQRLRGFCREKRRLYPACSRYHVSYLVRKFESFHGFTTRAFAFAASARSYISVAVFVVDVPAANANFVSRTLFLVQYLSVIFFYICSSCFSQTSRDSVLNGRPGLISIACISV